MVKPLLNDTILYGYESIYMLIIFFVDKSEQYHYSKLLLITTIL